jgi:hypothetical protein
MKQVKIIAVAAMTFATAAHAYGGGDEQLFAPATGSASWLANFLVTFTSSVMGLLPPGN